MNGCGAGRDRCTEAGEPTPRYDPYHNYAGKWHDYCWDLYGYGGFVFDASYAGESLEEDE